MRAEPEPVLAPARRRRSVRRRVPFIRQVEAVECGAAALAMVLAHHGAWHPLEELRGLCGVSRDGSKAGNLLRAARSLGLAANGYRMEPQSLRDLPWPLIVHWNFNHYVVVEGLNRTHAFICDPAAGRRRVPLAEFGRCFTGIALAFAPTAAFRRTRPPRSLFDALRERTAKSRVAVLLILLLSVVLIVPGIVLPVFAKLFVDGIVIRNQEHWIAPLLLMFAATALLRALLTMLRQSLMLRLQAKLMVVGASSFLWHVTRLPVGFFLQRHPGEIATRIGASGRVARLIASDLANGVLDLGTALAFALILVAYDAPIGAANLLLAVPGVVMVVILRRVLVEMSSAESADLGRLYASTVGIITGIETIKASGIENVAFGKWAGHHARTLDSSRRLGTAGLALKLTPSVFAGLTDVAILGLGAYRMAQGAITVGDLVAIQTLARSFSAPFGRVFGLATTFGSVAAEFARIDDAVRNPIDPMLVAPADSGEPARLRGALTVADVSYGYGPLAPPLLKEIGLSVAPGHRVAIVGRSGCGKSTLGRVICGLVPPSRGSVSIDGRHLRTLSRRERTETLAYVDQDIFLFEGTVRDNLTLWQPGISDAVLTRALTDAALLDEIVARDGGLDAPVEEGGRNFSGGQRQRLEIARALVGDPAILILDEASAALDPGTEQRIDENLRRRGCTCIIIAHRLSTVRDCSEIIVLREGSIVERGTHETLMARNGEYADLARSG